MIFKISVSFITPVAMTLVFLKPDKMAKLMNLFLLPTYEHAYHYKKTTHLKARIKHGNWNVEFLSSHKVLSSQANTPRLTFVEAKFYFHCACHATTYTTAKNPTLVVFEEFVNNFPPFHPFLTIRCSLIPNFNFPNLGSSRL